MYDRTVALSCPRGSRAGGVIHRFVKAVRAETAFPAKTAKVAARPLGVHHQRHRAGVGRDDQIVGQTPFESQSRNAECPVLIVQVRIGLVIPGLRNAPRHATLAPVFDLPPHHRVIGLVQQRVLVGRHDQQRHQVLEHRSAPGEQRHSAAGVGQSAAQAEPVLLRELPLRDRDKASQPRFRRQQIVKPAVEALVGDVVSDAEKVAVLVIEESVIDVGQLPAANRQLPQIRNAFRRGFRGRNDRGPQRRESVAGSGNQKSPRRSPEARWIPVAPHRQASALLQLPEHIPHFTEVRRLGLTHRPNPGSHLIQIFAEQTALPLDGFGPRLQLAIRSNRRDQGSRPPRPAAARATGESDRVRGGARRLSRNPSNGTISNRGAPADAASRLEQEIER